MTAIRIAVDAMGGDQAPLVEVEGAVQAATEYGIPIVLVGQEDRIHEHLRKHDAANLPIGEEDSKGNELTKEAFKSLKRAPINFIGNVEGRDIFKGDVDVIVCDGFTGNVALKLSEGLIETFTAMLRQELEKTLAAKVGYIFSEKAFRAFRRRLDYSEYGGAPLLGINGITIVCHGRSNANAIKNAVRVANDFCKHNVNRAIETEFTKLGITRTAGVISDFSSERSGAV